jgi:3-hydroxyisobutyrate dehydrogenase-like beta-hydroxyacid dehydrogenase
MTPTIAVIAPGAMGSAVARRLAEHGVRVLTSLAGRSPATLERAAAAGMIGVDDRQIAAADVILSILPPAEAVAFAQRLAPALALVAHRPIFVDCNAVDVGTVQRVAAVLGTGPARFVDGAIIGAPPEPGKAGPALYLAGEPAAELLFLQQLGIRAQVIEGPVGAASALKMSYAGITKGLTALAAAMVLAASRAGAAPALRAELAASQPQLLKRFGTTLPDMVPKAYRWAAEMREIAAFVQEDRAAARIYEAAGDFYERIAADLGEGRQEIALLDAFLNLPD